MHDEPHLHSDRRQKSFMMEWRRLLGALDLPFILSSLLKPVAERRDFWELEKGGEEGGCENAFFFAFTSVFFILPAAVATEKPDISTERCCIPQ